MNKEICIILDNIRSAHNVGSIFRTAEGAGVSKIYLLGYTPAPIDRFGRPVAEIKKTSLGASDMITWEHVENNKSDDLIVRLKSEGVQIVAVEQSPRSVSLSELERAQKVCYVLGNEIDGVSKKFLDLSDCIVEIPLHGRKESLNVSVAAGIVLFYDRLR